jgi:hypothetical protein
MVQANQPLIFIKMCYSQLLMATMFSFAHFTKSGLFIWPWLLMLNDPALSRAGHVLLQPACLKCQTAVNPYLI